MKSLSLFPILLLSLISCSSETDSVVEQTDSIVQREGLHYKKFSDTPFTGEFIKYRENGELEQKENYKDGKKEGEWIQYYSNGEVAEKGSYKNGKKEGEWIYNHFSGELFFKGSYKNGKEEGEWLVYNIDGTVNDYMTGIYNDDEEKVGD